MTVATITPHVRSAEAPEALRSLHAWLTWRFEPNDNPGGKPRKVPYYADGGRRYGVQGTREDRSRLVTFDAAKRAAARRGYDGVGFAPLPEFDILALDFDNCILANGRIHPDVVACLDATYAEYSPSGNGIRAFFTGQLGNNKAHGEPFGMELFSSKGFVTFTGNVLDLVEIAGNTNVVAPITEAVRTLVRQRFKRQLEEVQANDGYATPPVGLDDQDIQRCLDALPDDLDYDAWLTTGMAIHHETRGQGFELWDEWSQRSPKYTTREYGIERWNSFGKGNGVAVTIRSLAHMANERGAEVEVGGVASADEFDDAPATSTAADGTVKALRFPVLTLGEFAARPPLDWIIKGVLPKAELAVLYGEPGSGKTFMALDLTMAIARGMQWRSKRTRSGRVVYVAAEGAGGFRNRCVAYAQHHQLDTANLPFGVIADAPNFLLRPDIDAVARSIGKCDLIVVDTLAQSMPGGNENAGEDVGKVLSHCKRLHRITGGMVLLVHHSGKDATKGARGWSGIKGAVDAELEVTRSAAGRALRLSKSKDGEDGLAWGFGLEIISIGQDEDGEAITSCVVLETDLPDPTRAVRVLGPVETIVNAVIQEMAEAQTSGIEIAAVLSESAKRLPEREGKRDTRRQHAKRALESLCNGDTAPYLLEDDGTITVV